MNQQQTHEQMLTTLFNEFAKGTGPLLAKGGTIQMSARLLNFLNRMLAGKKISATARAFKDLLSQTVSLSVEGTNGVDSMTPIDIPALFPNLKKLQLVRVKPAALLRLRELSRTLAELRAVECIGSFEELLDVRWSDPENVSFSHRNPLSRLTEVDGLDRDMADMRDDGVWANLKSLSVEGNYIPIMDKSLQLLASAEKVNMSTNCFKTIENLHVCYSLTHLNLAGNRLTALDNVSLTLGSVRHLNLSNNMIASTNGLERLMALEELDLSRNRIASQVEIDNLSDLPLLKKASFAGNPVAENPDYRFMTLYSFRARIKTFVLDGSTATRSDLDAIAQRSRNGGQIITQRAQEPEQRRIPTDVPTGDNSSSDYMENPFGYSPSPAHFSATSSRKKKTKKKRTAMIDDIDPATNPFAADSSSQLGMSGSFNPFNDDTDTNPDGWKDAMRKARATKGSGWLDIMDNYDNDKNFTPEDIAVSTSTNPFDDGPALESIIGNSAPLPDIYQHEKVAPEDARRAEAAEAAAKRAEEQKKAAAKLIVEKPKEKTIRDVPYDQPNVKANLRGSCIMNYDPENERKTLSQFSMIRTSVLRQSFPPEYSVVERVYDSASMAMATAESFHDEVLSSSAHVTEDAINTELRDNTPEWVVKTVFGGNEDEMLMTSIRCNVIRARVSKTEIPCLVMLTTNRVHILNIKKEFTDAREIGKCCTVLQSISLMAIQHIVGGPNNQYFRIETQTQSFMCLTRVSKLTKLFLEMMIQNIKRCRRNENVSTEVSVFIPEDAIKQNFHRNILTNKKRQSACSCDPSGYDFVVYNLCNIIEGKKRIPRTLVVADSALFLTREDLSAWPISPASTYAPPSSAQFDFDGEIAVIDLSDVKVNRDGLTLTITFSKDNPDGKKGKTETAYMQTILEFFSADDCMSVSTLIKDYYTAETRMTLPQIPYLV